MEKARLYIPGWVSGVYIGLSLILLPWTIYLMITLPTRHITRHWDASWAGFDIVLLGAFLATAVFGYIHSKWIIMTATAAATLMLVDAWFDVLGERAGSGLIRAIIMAAIVEIPLAVISYTIAWRVIAKNIK